MPPHLCLLPSQERVSNTGGDLFLVFLNQMAVEILCCGYLVTTKLLRHGSGPVCCMRCLVPDCTLGLAALRWPDSSVDPQM